MNNYIVSSLSTSFTTITLALFVFFKNRRRSVNRVFALYTLSIGIWSYGFYKMITAANIEQGFFWSRALHIGSLFIPTLFLHFVLVMIGRANKQRKIIITTYIISFAFLLICPTKLFISTPVPKDVFTYFVNPGPLYYAYIAFFFVCIVYTHYELFRAYRKSKGIKRNQIKYLLLAYWIGYTGGATAFFPLFNIHMPSLGLYTIPLCMIMIAWTIVRYHLMDITLIFREILVSFAYSVIVGIIFMPLAISAQRSSLGLGAIIITLIITAPYIHRLLAKRFFSIIDTLVFKRKYDYIERLEKSIDKIVFIPKEENLLKNIPQTLSSVLGVKKIAIFTHDIALDDYYIRSQIGLDEIGEMRIPLKTGIVKWLKENKQIFIKEEAEKMLKEDDIRQVNTDIGRLDCSICIPVLLEDDLKGMITLSEKTSGEMYSHIDIRILQRLGNQLALALDYKRIEAELHKEHELATITRNRLNAITTMSYGLADRIRNDLFSIYAFLGDLPDKIKELKDKLPVNVIESLENHYKASQMGVDKLIKLATEITGICKPQGFNPQEYDPKIIIELADEAEKELEFEMQNKEIRIEKVITGTPPVIYFDKEAIKRVLWNLIQNSIHAIPEGRKGLIKITVTGPVKRDGREFLRIIIEDNGVGIPAENLENIFNPFFTTKGTAGGLGLGLTICQFIVNQHDGIIEIEHTELEKGTIICVDLPVRNEPPKATMDYKDILGEFPLRKKKGGLDEIKGIIDKIIGEPPSGERNN